MSDTVEAGCDTVVLRTAATVVETCVAVLTLTPPVATPRLWASTNGRQWASGNDREWI